MAAQQGFDVKCYTALVGLAEYFRTCHPPRVRECIHCLQASLNIGLPAILDAKVRLNIGKLLLEETNNLGHARSHLQQALFGPEADKVFFESANLLARFCSEQNQTSLAKNILRSALERSAQSKFYLWHYKLIFKLAEIHADDREFSIAIELLSAIGEQTAEQHGHIYIKFLFKLSKLMYLLATRSTDKFEQQIGPTDADVDNFRPQLANQRETVRVFWNLLKSYYFIFVGQPKSGKACLKALQQSVQLLNVAGEEAHSVADPQAMQWMTKDQICVLVYLYLLATRSTDKFEQQIGPTDADVDNFRPQLANQRETVRVFWNLLKSYYFIFVGQPKSGKACLKALQQSVQLLNVAGEEAHSVADPQAMQWMTKDQICVLVYLGLYGMSMNLMGDAAEHFRKAVELSVKGSEIFNIAALNLAIIYARGGEAKKQELLDMFEKLNNASVMRSQALQAGYLYVKGLVSFFNANYHEAKKYLRETLRIGNAEDLNRITACSLVLLGHVVTASGNPQEALSMVIPAMQLAAKVPDVYLQLWSASLLKDRQRCGTVLPDI
eukprot:gene5923-11266_t